MICSLRQIFTLVNKHQSVDMSSRSSRSSSEASIYTIDAEAEDEFPDFFKVSMKLATWVVQSKRYQNTLCEVFSEFDATVLNNYLKTVSLPIDVIIYKKFLDAYACVYPVKPEGIHFNPGMLASMKRMGKKERTKSEADDMLADHIGMLSTLLVRESSHVCNYKHNTTVVDLTNSTPVKTLDNKQFSDFGQMIEFLLFGGVLHHRGSMNLSFDIQSLGLYPVNGVNVGTGVEVKFNKKILRMTRDEFLAGFEKKTLNWYVVGKQFAVGGSVAAGGGSSSSSSAMASSAAEAVPESRWSLYDFDAEDMGEIDPHNPGYYKDGVPIARPAFPLLFK